VEVAFSSGSTLCSPLNSTSTPNLWVLVDCDRSTATSSTESFTVALIINVVITSIVLMLFVLLYPRSPRVYQPRLMFASKPPTPLPKVGQRILTLQFQHNVALHACTPICGHLAGNQPRFRDKCPSRIAFQVWHSHMYPAHKCAWAYGLIPGSVSVPCRVSLALCDG